ASAPSVLVAAPGPRPQPPIPTPPSATPSLAPEAASTSGKPGEPRAGAGFVLEAQKLSGDQPPLPAHLSPANPGRKLTGVYKICVNLEGHVYQVSAVAPISGADAEIMQALRAWKYRPQRANVCGTRVLAYQVP